MKKYSFSLIFCFLAIFYSTLPINAIENSSAHNAFNKLKTLVGVWKRQDVDENIFKVKFELLANETVLVETWVQRDKKKSITIYHLDDINLLATHYCPQGNQPRLKLAKLKDKDKLKFDYMDATNLSSLNDSHQHSLGFDFTNSNDSIIRHEMYMSNLGQEHSKLLLKRIHN